MLKCENHPTKLGKEIDHDFGKSILCKECWVAMSLESTGLDNTTEIGRSWIKGAEQIWDIARIDITPPPNALGEGD